MHTQALDLDPFEREQPMTMEEVWTYLGICRADFFRLKCPRAPEFDPLLPKPDRLFGGRLTFKKGEVFDYLVARRAAARAASLAGVDVDTTQEPIARLKVAETATERGQTIPLKLNGKGLRRSSRASAIEHVRSNNSTRTAKPAALPIPSVETPKGDRQSNETDADSAGSIIYSKLGAVHA